MRLAHLPDRYHGPRDRNRTSALLKSTSRIRTHASRGICLAAVLLLAGCVTQPGPSVPFREGANLIAARDAVRSCSGVAPKGGRNVVTGSYVAGVILGGLVLGPVYVASNEENIRAHGEAQAVDRCLADRGFVRRNLSEAEVQALRGRDPYSRQNLLNHLIGGGSLETSPNV